MTIEVTDHTMAPQPACTCTKLCSCKRILHPDAKARRDDLTAKGYCLNGETHGPATCGRRCDWCREVHRRGIAVVLADPAMASVQPPGYKYIPRAPMRRTALGPESVTPAG